MAMFKDFKSTHLKKGTEGTSNEISFDVLQQKKLATADTRKEAPWEFSANGKTKKFSARHPEHWVKILAIVIACLVSLVLALMGIASVMQRMSGSLDRMKSQIQQVKQASEDFEEVITTANTLLNFEASEIGNALSEQKISNAETSCDKLKKTLEKDKESITSTLSEIGTPSDRESGNNAISLVNKELLLAERFSNVVSYGKPYVALKTSTTHALKKLVEADSADKQASSQLTAGSVDEARKSIEAAEQAKSLAQEASELFEKAMQINENSPVELIDESKFKEYLKYCQLVEDAQDATIASANAYIDRNKEELEKKNAEYNSLKEKASAISNAWDKSIDELIDNAYSEMRAKDIDGFNQDLKERDSLLSSVNKYLKGNE